MKRIKFNQDIRPLSEFRANTAALIEQVRSTKRPMVITQHGKSSAVILDVQEYESLIEKIELLQEIQIAESQLQQGLGIEHDEAKKQTLSRLRKKK
ncbi:phd_YefM [bacterium BMS3Abin03]|nr:phd_YefM [bacterium BMS3Abin03]